MYPSKVIFCKVYDLLWGTQTLYRHVGGGNTVNTKKKKHPLHIRYQALKFLFDKLSR